MIREASAVSDWFGRVEFDPDRMLSLIQDWRASFQRDHKRKAKLVFTNGVFDLLHYGHVHYLAEARSLGDALIVAVNRDDSVRRLKGPTRPIQNEVDRAEILSSLKSVQFVTWFGEDTPLKLIELFEPDVLVKGGDWAVDQIVGSRFVLDRGGTVRSLEFKDGRSTTSIVQKIHSR